MGGWLNTGYKASLSQAELGCCWKWAELGNFNPFGALSEVATFLDSNKMYAFYLLCIALFLFLILHLWASF